MDGRFDVLTLHVALLLARLGQLGPEGHKLGQAVFDRMFRDIEQTLRETGVGDLGVPKHMAKMMKAFNGRVHVYHSALSENNIAALETAIARNVYRMEQIPAPAVAIAGYALTVKESLESYTLENFQRGQVAYPAPLNHTEQRKAAYA